MLICGYIIAVAKIFGIRFAQIPSTASKSLGAWESSHRTATMRMTDVPNVPDANDTIDQSATTPRPASRVRIACGSMTHPGKVRKNNEDHFLVARLAKSMQICQ